MKTIQEEANKISVGKENETESIECFKMGVEFAQRWIPVEEELPERQPSGFSELVLTRNKSGTIRVERYDYEFNHFTEMRFDSHVTFWRPIELF